MSLTHLMAINPKYFTQTHKFHPGTHPSIWHHEGLYKFMAIHPTLVKTECWTGRLTDRQCSPRRHAASMAKNNSSFKGGAVRMKIKSHQTPEHTVYLITVDKLIDMHYTYLYSSICLYNKNIHIKGIETK